MAEKRQIILIGGGVGALAAALRLAGDSTVTLYEQGSRVGGKLNRWQPEGSPELAGGFSFDTGPSLLTLPFVFEQLFAAAGEKMADHLELIRLDPISQFIWPDGQRFAIRSNLDETLAEVRQFSPADVDGWRAFIHHGQKIWDLTGDLFLQHAPEQLLRGKGFAPAKAMRMLTVPFRIGIFSTYSKLVDRHVRHPRLREVLYQYATYSGASPFKAPATLGVIPFAEQHFGGWYPRGGMYKLAEALEAIARKRGVMIHTNTPVRQVLIEGKSKHRRAVGVRLADGTKLSADGVIVNCDTISAYRELIPPEHRPRYPDAKLDAMDPGGSGLVLLLCVRGTYPQLAHHTKFMPIDYRNDLAAMFDSKTIPTDPCIYVCASTRTDPSQAPRDCENLFVLASAPALDGSIDWTIEGPRYRNRLIHTLEHRFGLTELSRRIITERQITPADLKSLYSANAGSIYGLGSNSRRSAFLRPPNRDRNVQHLFFVGGATHPGGGLPLVALSGKIVSELVSAHNRPF